MQFREKRRIAHQMKAIAPTIPRFVGGIIPQIPATFEDQQRPVFVL